MIASPALVAGWDAVRRVKPEQSQVMLAFTRADVHDLNQLARAKVRVAGALGADRILTTERGERTFAAGDQVMFLRNERSLGVKNGTLGTLERLEGSSFTVRLDGADWRTVCFDLKDYAHVDHGYAATIHKAQGVTVDRAHVLASSSMDRHAAYVSLSRHREGVELHWAREDVRDRAGLERTLSRERVKDTTLDYQAGFAERCGIDMSRGAVPDVAKEQRDSVPAHSTAARLEARLAERQSQGQEGARLDRSSAAARLQARLGAERMATIKQKVERSRERDRGLER